MLAQFGDICDYNLVDINYHYCGASCSCAVTLNDPRSSPISPYWAQRHYFTTYAEREVFSCLQELLLPLICKRLSVFWQNFSQFHPHREKLVVEVDRKEGDDLVYIVLWLCTVLFCWLVQGLWGNTKDRLFVELWLVVWSCQKAALK